MSLTADADHLGFRMLESMPFQAFFKHLKPFKASSRRQGLEKDVVNAGDAPRERGAGPEEVSHHLEGQLAGEDITDDVDIPKHLVDGHQNPLGAQRHGTSREDGGRSHGH